MDADNREQGLIRWQWSLYGEGHQDRRNLAIHFLTAPLFLAGTCALISSPFLGVAGAISGLVAMVLAVALQGRGHKLEKAKPVPFRGPLDVAARLFVEQWVNFPRYVISGRFGQAWRSANPSSR